MTLTASMDAVFFTFELQSTIRKETCPMIGYLPHDYDYKIKQKTVQERFNDRLNQLGFSHLGDFNDELFKQSALYKSHPEALTYLMHCRKQVPYNYLGQMNFKDITTYSGKIEGQHEYRLPVGSYDWLCIRPYYWGNMDVISNVPNFEYTPLDLRIKWYKYALRNGQSTHKLTNTLIDTIFDDVENEIKHRCKNTNLYPVGHIETISEKNNRSKKENDNAR